MFRDIKRDAFHRSHPLVPAMNASTTPISCLTLPHTSSCTYTDTYPSLPGTQLPTGAGKAGKAGLLDQSYPRMVIRQIYSLARATTTHEHAIYYTPGDQEPDTRFYDVFAQG